MAIKISLSQLKADVESGMKKKALCEKYSTTEVKMSASEMGRLLKEAGLSIKRTRAKKFSLENDLVSNTQSNTINN